MKWQWYLTIAALRQWMTMTGRGGPAEESNPNFLAAERELGEFSLTARLVKVDERFGCSIYRGSISVDGKTVRLEADVVSAARAEGSLPQLVRVRSKRR